MTVLHPGPATALDAGLTRQHHESRRRRYGLADRARRLSWDEPITVDDDLGRSDGGSAPSPGFESSLASQPPFPASPRKSESAP